MSKMVDLGAGVKTDGNPSELALKVIRRLNEMKVNKAMLAIELGCSRSMVSRYLAGKYTSDPSTVEKALKDWLAQVGDPQEGSRGKDTPETGTPERVAVIPPKPAVFRSGDYMSVISVCQSCQEDTGLGIIVGRTGYGKTHALKSYAKLPRVAYIECDDTMGSRDLVEALEQALGIPHANGTVWKRVSRIREFLNVNTGYLVIVDEADKLMNKYTAAKIEIIRSIFDQSDVGIVIAGEPKLEASLKSWLPRFANRVDFYYKLRGLTKQELSEYLSGWSVTPEAGTVLAERAFGERGGCFRLLDRTLNNVRRVLSGRGEAVVTAEVMREASGMMMLQ